MHPDQFEPQRCVTFGFRGTYLSDERLQEPLHRQGPDLEALGIPFQQDGGGGGRHGL